MQVDLSLYKKLIIPINRGAHWSVAVVDFQREQFRHYDSKFGDYIIGLKRILW